ncbi:MAG: PH domain-containing protein [Myxococcales bacterium]|nr:PH domain-containing protein [Myxococcales bacterium]
MSGDLEPIRGLPEDLPEGERILWQGEPSWWALARWAFHVPKLAVYFGVFAVARGLMQAWSGAALGDAVFASLEVVPLALAALAILSLLAWLNARAAVFTITNRRVVVRFGIALSLTVNLPFNMVRSAGLRLRSGGAGDIALGLEGKRRIAYLHMWPFVRQWRFAHTEPMLRGLPEAAKVAEILAGALVDGGYGVMNAVDVEPRAVVRRAVRTTPRLVPRPE